VSRKILNESTLAAWKEIDKDNWQKLVAEIATIFFEVGALQFSQLSQFWAIKDLEGIKKTAHSLKSSCGNVGAEEAHYLLDLIERAAEAGELDKLPELMGKLPAIFIESNALLRKYIQEYQAA
jgi:HPt (histidine-containing phosphotransfer) domain-containing protein